MGHYKPKLFISVKVGTKSRNIVDEYSDPVAYPEEGDVLTPVNLGNVSALELARYLDSDAENENLHHLAGRYEEFCEKFEAIFGEPIARRIMWEFAMDGGLQGV